MKKNLTPASLKDLGRIDIQIACWRELRERLSEALLRRESLYGLLLQKERG